MTYALAKIKTLRNQLGAIGKQTARVRDQLRTLLEDAEEELKVVDDAQATLDQLIDRLSEHH